MLIRPYRDGDTEEVIATVRSVFDEYGFSWDEDGYCSDLKNIAAEYDAFWVAELDGQVMGCVGYCKHETIPGDANTAVQHEGVTRVAQTEGELYRLYVRPQARGYRLGRRLTEVVMDEARVRGGRAIELWSDKKLTHAHALYKSLGATVVGERICPGDPDESPEWGFRLPL